MRMTTDFGILISYGNICTGRHYVHTVACTVHSSQQHIHALTYSRNTHLPRLLMVCGLRGYEKVVVILIAIDE